MNDKPDFVPATVRTEPVQQRSAERITSLLDAAAELIDKNGIDGLTTSDVATRSGSSVGVVYRYFPNIQSLLRALASRNMEKFTARIFGGMSDEPAHWMDGMDVAIDGYVELLRTEPGFRALGFGDVIDKRFVQPDMSNNSVLAREFTALFTRKYGLTPSDELAFDFEIIVEIADSILHRAFLYDPKGDERFIAKLREIVRDYMGKHA
ncbi:MAG: TetR family transcriptional regulator [Micrococcales bacterium 70-64]|nr:TetR family transcriptional regulator [Leifsonia sp.]ODU64606.1 MAG: TetR family transcriptional regulator [Leifsonia sp. SCN 70-46]OJX86298.1 MAG: TetR family transcriptional regulator [Micrococcales bacterium 70-64]